jgi:pimeloyl-ACP methyl ester carboxylesterase
MTRSSRRTPASAWRLADLRAAAALAQRASEGVIDITEGVHQSVRGTLGLPPGLSEDRCGGLSGRVYGVLRGAHALVGNGAQSALRGLEGLLRDSDAMPEPPDDPKRLAWLAVLNGVCGDHLHATGNALAIQPGLYPSTTTDDADAASGEHLLVLVHGLCMNDLQWRSRGDVGHGEALAGALGASSLYFRYNTGLSIEHNGLQLAQALDRAVSARPRPPARISLIGHSMGGLVARSAEKHARVEGQAWRERLRELVLLGTPNEGAPLERLGHAFQGVLGRTPYARHFTRLGALRSRGILDLREGRFTESDDSRLPADLRCLVVAAQLARSAQRPGARLLGDGLVPVDSALGRNALGRAADVEHVAPATGHLQLLRSQSVRAELLRWLREG